MLRAKVMTSLAGTMAVSSPANAGMVAAKDRGVQMGRKPALTEKALADAITMINGGSTIPETAKALGIGKSTLYRYIATL